MKLFRQQESGHDQAQGFALIMVMVFSGISIIALSGALNWASNAAISNDRNNEYFKASAAAEAATEKVMASVIKDFQQDGESLVYANLGSYTAKIPNVDENSFSHSLPPDCTPAR